MPRLRPTGSEVPLCDECHNPGGLSFNIDTGAWLCPGCFEISQLPRRRAIPTHPTPLEPSTTAVPPPAPQPHRQATNHGHRPATPRPSPKQQSKKPQEMNLLLKVYKRGNRFIGEITIVESGELLAKKEGRTKTHLSRALRTTNLVPSNMSIKKVQTTPYTVLRHP